MKEKIKSLESSKVVDNEGTKEIPLQKTRYSQSLLEKFRKASWQWEKSCIFNLPALLASLLTLDEQKQTENENRTLTPRFGISDREVTSFSRMAYDWTV